MNYIPQWLLYCFTAGFWWIAATIIIAFFLAVFFTVVCDKYDKDLLSASFVFLWFLAVFLLGFLWCYKPYENWQKLHKVRITVSGDSLVEAARQGNIELLRLFLKGKVNLNQKDSHGTNALMAAVQAKQREAIEFLVEEGKVNINKSCHDGMNPLLIASSAGDKWVVEFLADRKAKLNVADINGETPLMKAASLGHSDICRVLLGHKEIDQDLTDIRRETALMKAASMIGENKGELAIIAKLLLEKGVGKDLKDINGETALMKAASSGNEEIIKVLLQNQARSDLRDKKGETAFMKAAAFDQEQVVNLLGKTGMDEVNEAGRTPLMLAAIGNCQKVVNNLAGQVKAVDQEDGEGRTALMYAFGQQNRAIAEILLKNKASPKKGIDQALKQSRNLKMLEFLESLNLEYGKNDIAKALSDLRKEGKTESVPVGAQ